MQNTRIKIINASHALSIRSYENTKRKLFTCNANIYFNQTCLKHNITPKYAHINIKTANKSEAAKHTEFQTKKITNCCV
jgi:hypothetical protein